VRANGVEPTTAANAALGVRGFMKAALGVRFLAGAFFATFLATFILVKFLDYILYAEKPFSWIGAFIFAYIILKYFTDSPFDNLPPGPHYFFFLFILLASLRRKNSN